MGIHKLRQRRLCTLTAKEHRLLEDKVLPITLSDVEIRRLFILKADEAMLETSESARVCSKNQQNSCTGRGLC